MASCVIHRSTTKCTQQQFRNFVTTSIQACRHARNWILYCTVCVSEEVTTNHCCAFRLFCTNRFPTPAVTDRTQAMFYAMCTWGSTALRSSQSEPTRDPSKGKHLSRSKPSPRPKNRQVGALRQVEHLLKSRCCFGLRSYFSTWESCQVIREEHRLIVSDLPGRKWTTQKPTSSQNTDRLRVRYFSARYCDRSRQQTSKVLCSAPATASAVSQFPTDGYLFNRDAADSAERHCTRVDQQC